MLLLYICAAVFVIAALYLFMIFPSVRRRDMIAFCEKPIAHRGIHDEVGVAENSMTAFRLAVEAGLPIELDVHITSDGIPVVIHDGNLKRLCGIDVNIRKLTKAELNEYRLTEGGEGIPTLREVLDLVSGRVPLLIELKGTDTSPVPERTAEVLYDYNGEYAIESFNPYHLCRFRRLVKNVPVGTLAERRYGGELWKRLFGFYAARGMYNFLFRPDFIAYRYSDELTLSVKLCRLLGARVFGWTVRSGEVYKLYCDKFDGLICEKISEIVK